MTYQSTGYLDGNTGYVVANPVANQWNTKSTWNTMNKWAGNFVNPMIYYTDVVDLGSSRYFNLRAEATTNGTVEYQVLTSNTSSFSTVFDREPLAVSAENVSTSTSVVKYGTQSLSFNGSNSYFTITNTSSFDFGTGAFTIEAWINPTQLGSSPTKESHIYYKGTGTTCLSLYLNHNSVSFRMPSGLSYVGSNVAPYAITTGTWQHIALCRTSDGTTRLFKDGYVIGLTTSSQNVSQASYPPIIGRDDNGIANTTSSYFKGYIDDLRISNTARYSTGALESQPFTPGHYINDTSTIFICSGELGVADSPNVLETVTETTIKNGDTNVPAFYGRYVSVGIQVTSADRPEIQNTTIIPTSRRFDILLPDVDLTTLTDTTASNHTKIVNLGRDVSHIQAVFLQKSSGLDDVGISPIVADKSVPSVGFIKATEGSQDYVYGGVGATVDPATMTSPVVDIHVHVLPEQYMENGVLKTR